MSRNNQPLRRTKNEGEVDGGAVGERFVQLTARGVILQPVKGLVRLGFRMNDVYGMRGLLLGLFRSINIGLKLKFLHVAK